MKTFTVLIFIIAFVSSSFAVETKSKTLSTILDTRGINVLDKNINEKPLIEDQYTLKFFLGASPFLQDNSYTFAKENASSFNKGASLLFKVEYQNLYALLSTSFSSGNLTASQANYLKDGESIRTYSAGFIVGYIYQRFSLGIGMLPYDRFVVNQLSSTYTTEADNTPITVIENLNMYGTAWTFSLTYKIFEKINLRGMFEKHRYTTSMAHYNNWNSANIYYPTELQRSSFGLYVDFFK